jgi:hypothetical protein
MNVSEVYMCECCKEIRILEFNVFCLFCQWFCGRVEYTGKGGRELHWWDYMLCRVGRGGWVHGWLLGFGRMKMEENRATLVYQDGGGGCRRERDNQRAQEAWNGSSTMQWMIFMSSFNNRTVKIQHTTQYNLREENGKGVSSLGVEGVEKKLLRSCNHRQS